MTKRKVSLVLSVALADRESFPVLPTKVQQKRIYNRCLQRLKRQGCEGELLKSKLISEVRSELFKLQPEFKPRKSQKIKDEISYEGSFFDRYKVVIRGYDIWSENAQEIDLLEQLERDYNETVAKGFRDVFCPNCRSNPCICREGY